MRLSFSVFSVENRLLGNDQRSLPFTMGRCWDITLACWRLLCCFPCRRRGSDVLDDSSISPGALLRYQVAPSIPTTSAATTVSSSAAPAVTGGAAVSQHEDDSQLLPKGTRPSDSVAAATALGTPSGKGAIPTAGEGVEHTLLSGFEAQRARLQEKLGAGSASCATLHDGLGLCDIYEDVCPTCLDPYTEDNPKITTKCHHHFHLACIYEWMERSQTCPMCGERMQFSEVL